MDVNTIKFDAWMDDADEDYDDDFFRCEWCGDKDGTCNCEAGLECVCGAYSRMKDGKVWHIADCICGAD